MTSQPTIMFCSQSAYTGGGMEQWLESIANELERLNWNVVVAFARGAKFHNPIRYLRTYSHKQWIELPATTGRREDRVAVLYKQFQIIKPAIVIPVGMIDVYHAIAKYRASGGNTKLVICIHGILTKPTQELKQHSESIDLLATVSAKTADVLRKCLNSKTEIAHIPSGVPAPIRSSNRTPISTLRLACISRLDNHEKRILDLISLIELIRGENYKLDVIGCGEEESKLKKHLSKEIETGQIVMHGYKTRATIYEEFYPDLHGILIFSPSEGGPLVAWEALRHGVVPITSDFLGRESEGVLIDKLNSLVFPVSDMELAAKAIKKLPHIWNELSTTATLIPNQYTLEGFSNSWDQALRRCLDKPSRNFNEPLLPARAPGRIAWLPNWLRTPLRRLVHSKHNPTSPADEWP